MGKITSKPLCQHDLLNVFEEQSCSVWPENRLRIKVDPLINTQFQAHRRLKDVKLRSLSLCGRLENISIEYLCSRAIISYDRLVHC
jgi:hypothetical protein